MKKISDYKGDSAIDLYAEILEPIGEILQDKEISQALSNKKSIMQIVGIAFRKYKEAVKKIVLSVDDTEIDGKNIFSRFTTIFIDVLNDKDFIDFFKQAEQVRTDGGSFGFVTENTEVKEN